MLNFGASKVAVMGGSASEMSQNILGLPNNAYMIRLII